MFTEKIENTINKSEIIDKNVLLRNLFCNKSKNCYHTFCGIDFISQQFV